jgi:branched-chain amino acid aminotransferase
MSTGKYILVNGSFIPAEEYRISLKESDAFLFSEKFRAVRTSFPFFAETLEIIKLKLLVYNQTFPEFIGNNGSGLLRQLERTLTKNKLFLGALLTVTFNSQDGKIHYRIVPEKYEPADFELNEKGLFVEVFDKLKKPSASLSNLSLGSEIYWNIARNQIRGTMTDQMLLVNTEDQVIEALESNLYLVNGDQIRGASCDQGAFLDISQPLLLSIFTKLQLHYSENVPITIHDIRLADEIMLVNAIDGVRWIVGFEGKRYFNHTIRKISDFFAKSLPS